MTTNDPLIVKKILHPGKKAITFRDGAKVHFHFQTKLCNAEQTVIDDSRKMGDGKPIHLVLGKKFKMEVWESIIQCMALDEVAQFRVDKSLVLQYPFVSKTLRDVHKPASQRRGHCCAMTLQTEGIGYDDLNDLIKTPTDLEFTIELVKVEHPDAYEKESWQLTDDERLDSIPDLKEKGNLAYKEKKYKEAADYYAKAIGILEQLLIKEKPHEEEWEKLNQQKIPLLLNFSQCVLNQGDFYGCIEHCTTVLKSDEDNVKALFRRGKAHVGAWNPELARRDFSRVAELDSSLELVVKKELAELDELIKKKNNEDKIRLKKMFAS